jgi:hypothetical protein
VPLQSKIAGSPTRSIKVGGNIQLAPSSIQEKMRSALQRVVKRIMIIKRLSIIRQVNQVIEKVSTRVDESENGEDRTAEETPMKLLSLKRLVKIMNLCQVYIPIAHIKSNNSTHLSLDVSDMMEIVKEKSAYKDFVNL